VLVVKVVCGSLVIACFTP
ncbi:DUF3265 domain-containing protein, partial [Vibrio parahaemolyticus]|nr:DUF3265 domain-containing protein [Vibrio parahaemolyticus]